MDDAATEGDAEAAETVLHEEPFIGSLSQNPADFHSPQRGDRGGYGMRHFRGGWCLVGDT